MCDNGHSATSRRHRVAVCAEDVLARNGIMALLARSAEFEILPPRSVADVDAIVVVRRGSDVVDVLREITQRVRTRFVAVAQDHPTIDLFAAAELGLASIVPFRGITADTLRGAVLAACTGGVQLPPDSQAILLTQMTRMKRELLDPRGLGLHGLDSREIDLLRLLAVGWDLKEIADKLGYSERTLKNVLHVLSGRLGVRNRTQAVAQAIRMGAV